MKKIFSVLLFFVFVCSFSVSASNYGQADIKTNGERVVDSADLLTSDEESLLTARLDEIYDEYNFEIVILTTNYMFGKNEQNFCADFYDYNGYGYGANYDGLMFMIDMGERSYYTMSTGSGQDYFNSAKCTSMGQSIQNYLSNGNYYFAFDRFIDNAVSGLNKDPYAIDWNRQAIYIVISIILAIVVVLVIKGTMNNAVKQNLANAYIETNSFNLHTRRDSYLYSTTTRTKIERNNSSGGGSFRGSSGRSHSGGGGKF